jgi:peptide/nickel transport system permease protein
MAAAGGSRTIGAGYTGLGRALDIARHLRAADADAGADLPGHLPADHARLDAGGAEPRFRAHRTREGLDETRVVVRHVLRNALLPMVTLIGLQAGTMLGGSVVVESVFSLPGLGGWPMNRWCSAT